MRLIGVEGEQIGVVTLEVATSMADEAEIDLVEIAPTAQPPVCRLMDYGKFRYQESKRKHEAKLKQKQVKIKEIRTDFKTRDVAKSFISEYQKRFPHYDFSMRIETPEIKENTVLRIFKKNYK